MYNKMILIGRLTADPELRHTGNGTPVTKFTVACQRTFQNTQGERETDFIDCVVWRGLAESCANNIKKGYMVAVDGRLQIRSYDDNQGVRRKAAEVIADNVRFLDRGKNGGSGSSAGTSSNQGQAHHEEDQFNEIPFTEDDLPF